MIKTIVPRSQQSKQLAPQSARFSTSTKNTNQEILAPIHRGKNPFSKRLTHRKHNVDCSVLTLQERKEKVRGLADIFLAKINSTTPEAKTVFYNIIDTVIEDTVELREIKADKSELKELIVAMEKRFEVMDRRFEDMQRHMDKRFDDVNKRFDDFNKRFDDFNQRFTQIQWLIGLGFTAITVALTVLRIFAK